MDRLADHFDRQTNAAGIYVRPANNQAGERDPWGTAIIVEYSHGGLAEIVIDGLNGFHVRPADPVDLADRLVWAAGHADAMLAAGQAAQAAFVSNYSAERGYARLIEVYERAIAVRSTRAAAGS